MHKLPRAVITIILLSQSSWHSTNTWWVLPQMSKSTKGSSSPFPAACAARAALPFHRHTTAADGAQHEPSSALQRHISTQAGNAAYVKIIVTFLFRVSGHRNQHFLLKKNIYINQSLPLNSCSMGKDVNKQSHPQNTFRRNTAGSTMLHQRHC